MIEKFRIKFLSYKAKFRDKIFMISISFIKFRETHYMILVSIRQSDGFGFSTYAGTEAS